MQKKFFFFKQVMPVITYDITAINSFLLLILQSNLSVLKNLKGYSFTSDINNYM